MAPSRFGTRLATALAAALLADAAPAQTVVDSSLTVDTVVSPNSGLDQPTTMAFLGPDDFLVLERSSGRVRRVVGGVLLPNPVLTVLVDDLSERGLLGIAINTETPRGVFLYYTEANAAETPLANRVYRYTWNQATGTLVSPALVLDLPVTNGPNHNGGVLLLGTPGEFPGVGDGAALYTVIGDLNRNGQLQNNAAGAAPDDTGVVFRVLQNGAAAPGNPFGPYCSVTTAQTCATNANCPGGETCRTQVARYWAYGVRNSFGLTLDAGTGHLWDTENGPGTNDEINLLLPGTNSGWTDLMGPDSLDPQGVADLFHMPNEGITYSDPEFTWVDTNAPTAIVFPIFSSLGAAYDSVALVGDNNLGQIYSFPLNAARSGFALQAPLADLVAADQTEANSVRFGSGFGAVTDLELSPDGDVYVVDIANGAIYRISGTRGPAIPTLPLWALALLAATLLLALLPPLERARARRRRGI